MVLINGVWCQKIYKIGFKLPQKLTDIILNFNGWQLITPGALYIRYCHACQMDSEFDLWVENTISPPITTHLSEVEVIFIPPYLSLSQYFPQRGREKDNFEKSRKAKQHFHVVDQWPSFSAFSPFHFWEQEALISTYMHLKNE